MKLKCCSEGNKPANVELLTKRFLSILNLDKSCDSVHDFKNRLRHLLGDKTLHVVVCCWELLCQV